ncbi:hypothetical protein ABZY09_49370 [Streptomyces sp. NPDC002928]|uniref:hypothetical protein n=1 Tax=Streptomyces sp. NPDC002928 TaxID=3154440 RepID=UPI0033AC215F
MSTAEIAALVRAAAAAVGAEFSPSAGGVASEGAAYRGSASGYVPVLVRGGADPLGTVAG